MKIAFHLNCLCHGGAERVVTTLAGQFAEEGNETLVATEWTDEVEYPLNPKVRRVHVGLRPEDEGKGRLTKILLRRKYLREFMLREKPDVLVAFAIKANYRACQACKGTNIPVVISVRIDPNAFYTGFVNSVMIRHLFPRAAGCVFQTEDAKKFFAPLLQDNSTIILNPIHEKYIQAPHTALSERKPYVVNVGRLVDFKDQALLIRAFARVHEKFPEYILKIYGPDSGDGTLELLEQTIREKKLEDVVQLMGDCSNLEETIRDAACFAYSSDYEGMPNALMEAMALGLPCVSTDCPPGGPRMIIQDGQNGRLVPIKDEVKLAEAIVETLADPKAAQKMGDAARRIRETANAETIYKQWKDYLTDIIAHGKRC